MNLLKEILTNNESLDNVLSKSKYSSQLEAILSMLAGNNVFLSGPAGSGKSFTIEKFISIAEQLWPDKVIGITSTTGISALNIGGKTIHSYAGMGFVNEPFKKMKNEWHEKNFFARQQIRDTDILIIDEISMFSEFQLRFLLDLVKDVRRRDWQDMQFIVSGDFTQLPPVASSSEPEEFRNFCYGTSAWKEIGFKDIYLDRVYRTEDIKLKEVLESIALGQEDKSLLDDFEIISQEDLLLTRHPILVSKNSEVNYYNKEKQKNNKSKKKYDSEIEPMYKYDEKENMKFIKECGLDPIVTIKEWDTVMITSNETDNIQYSNHMSPGCPRLQNGMIGTIVNLDTNTGSFEFHYDDPDTGETYVYEIDGKIKYVKTKKVIREIPAINEETGEVLLDPKTQKPIIAQVIKEDVPIAGFYHLPVKLAYAISIHKSQGQTFSHLICNLSNCWMENLGYVALSRGKSYKGIKLIKPNNYRPVIGSKALKINPRSLEIKKTVLQNAYIGTKNTRVLSIKDNLNKIKETAKKPVKKRY